MYTGRHDWSPSQLVARLCLVQRLPALSGQKCVLAQLAMGVLVLVLVCRLQGQGRRPPGDSAAPLMS